MENIKEILLCKYGEIVLKGANRSTFEAMLTREIKKRAVQFGKFKTTNLQSTVYVSPLEEDCDLDGMFECLKKIFGIAGVTRAAIAEKNMQSIIETAKAYLPDKLCGKKTFRVDAKRSDKLFPLQSPQIAAEVGGAVLSVLPKMRVDLHNPQSMIRVEVRDHAAYIHADQQKSLCLGCC